MSDKPAVEPHLGSPPDDLLIEEIIVGEGPEAIDGQHAVVHYVGVGATSGEEFDASWNRNEPFDFELGAVRFHSQQMRKERRGDGTERGPGLR